MFPKVAVVGGGITGACVASLLSNTFDVKVDLFDQGRRGPGGRASHRIEQEKRWDHGCQFFRADTQSFLSHVNEWIQKGYCMEYKGKFGSNHSDADFFGFPSKPPFFIGIEGMTTVVDRLLNDCPSETFSLHAGQRVSSILRDPQTQEWTIFGTGGEAAYHDTPEAMASKAEYNSLGTGYAAVVLTDVSSSFGAWHRASAGVPESFAAQVQQRAGSRVPLFAAMISFDGPLPLNLDAIAINHPVIWFASRTNSKAGFHDNLKSECWTLISTPMYAIEKIKQTPMQDSKTGEFIPQAKEYLKEVPGPEMENAFREVLLSGDLGEIQNLPKTTHIDAQRWGSALPSRRPVSNGELIAGVAYDSPLDCLAPTQRVSDFPNSFVFDEDQMLFQAGDMMSCYSPGFESAALSGLDAATHLHALLTQKKVKL